MAPLAADSACEIPPIDGLNSRSAMPSKAQSRITRPCKAHHMASLVGSISNIFCGMLPRQAFLTDAEVSLSASFFRA